MLPISILASQVVDGPHNDFPLLINLNDVRLRTIANAGNIENVNGWDIVFTLDDETTLLSHQIMEYGPATGVYKAYVRIPVLSSAANQTIYIHFGNSSIMTNPSTNSTWNAGFTNVYHMEGNPSGSAPQILDASANNHHLTTTAATPVPTSTAGLQGLATSHPGNANSAYFQRASPLPAGMQYNGASAITMEGWLRLPPGGLNEDMAILLKGNGINSEKYFLGASVPGDVLTIRLTTTTGYVRLDGTNALPADEWIHIAAVYDGVRYKGYVNGVLEIDVAKTGTITHAADDDVRVAGRHDGRRFNGLLDEIRISNVVRSEGWLATSRLNADLPADFTEIDPVPPPALSGYVGRLQLCANESEMGHTSDLSGFPLYVNIQNDLLRTQANGGELQNDNGWDMVFTDESGTNQIPFEITHYNASSGAVQGWVRLPTLYESTNTNFYLYYGNATSFNQSSTTTWDTSYEGVYHFDNNNLLDATYRNRDGANIGSTNNTSGRMGEARNFAGANDRVEVGNWNVSGSALTLSAWVRHTTVATNDPRTIAKGNGGGGQEQVFYMGHRNSGGNRVVGGRLKTGTNDGAGSVTLANGTLAITANVWQLHTLVYNGSTVRSYLNGALVGSVAKTGSLRENNWTIAIGNNVSGLRAFNGAIDEVRIQNVALSQDWIQAEFDNQNNVADVISCMVEEGNPLPVTLASFTGFYNPELKAAKLRWTTLAEVNNSHFILERSADGKHYNHVATVEGNGTTQQSQRYSFADPLAEMGNYFYRLTQVDYDGKSEQFEPILIKVNGQTLVPQLYPNPASSSVHVNHADWASHYSIMDLQGRMLGQHSFDAQTDINIKALPAGTYLLKLADDASSRHAVLRFSKQ